MRAQSSLFPLYLFVNLNHLIYYCGGATKTKLESILRQNTTESKPLIYSIPRPCNPTITVSIATMTARVQPSSGQEEQIRKQKRLEDLEAKAVAEAKASADASFRPSPSLLNAASAEALMSQVDGPSLSTYEGKESVYVGRSVPVSAGGKLEVPINVSSPGSVVEYFIEIKTHDISIEITAERDEGETAVKVRHRMK